ncbi:MAG: response regulator, partial [Verrucomicrobiota bacterium]|nr:response regulator [Verrucomicrobiota bacterium]
MLTSITHSVSGCPRIILIEGYHALAVAFRAALNRVSPESEVRICGSLDEATVAAGERDHDLVVIDADPPLPGSVTFLNRLGSASPGTKVLIIAAHSAPELEGRTSRARALHFIKKPFELTEFAAVTEALLSSSVSASEAASGALRDLALVDFILLQAANAATTALEVETPQGRSGEIHFAGGRICHAMVMGEAGSPALEEMMRWPVTSCREIERRTDAPRSIRGEWKDVLSRAWRAVDRTDTPVSKSEPGPSSALLPRRKLVVIDDTEMLLILVKEVLGAADPSFEITTAKSGKEGVERISALIPDLVLLDYSLPDITGSEVCRRLLADQRTADIPLIMMSGHVVEMMAAAGEHPNIVATIAKPFLSTSLVALVNQTLVDLANPAPETPKRRKAARVKAGKPHPTRTDHEESRNGNPMAAATLSRKPSSSSAKEPVTPPASGPSESEAPGTGTQGDSPQNSEVLPSSPAPPKSASPEPAAPLPGASSEMRTETI